MKLFLLSILLALFSSCNNVVTAATPATPATPAQSNNGLSPPRIRKSLGFRKKMMKPSFIPSARLIDDNSSVVRGGAGDDDDSPTTIIMKTTISTAMLTAALYGILKLGEYLANTFDQIPKFFGLSLANYVAFFILAFLATFVDSILQGGLSIAAGQRLTPSEPPNQEWYDKLVKPSWNPPDWLFPIMWVIVSKPTQILAMRQLYITDKATTIPLIIYSLSLALGNAWNNVFFAYEQIFLGALVITAYYASLWGTSVLFGLPSKETAALFMLPTIGWVTVATALNWSIFNLNKED